MWTSSTVFLGLRRHTDGSRCVVAGELGLFAETLHAAALREGRLQQQEGSPRQQEGSAQQQQQTVRFESHLYVTGNADDGTHSRTRADRSLFPLTFPLTIPRLCGCRR